MFDKSASRYSLSATPTLENSVPNFEDEASDADTIVEEKIGTQDESSIAFQLSGPMEELS